MKPIALITGASSGIGRATAIKLASNYNLIICARRQDRLEQLQTELVAITDVQCLSFDVRDKGAINTAFTSLPDQWKTIDVLINNAGNAHGLSPIHQGDSDDWDAMIDINVKGLLNVSKQIIPQMVERQQGHIVNIGSIAGKEVYANGNVYCASKFAVEAITSSMRIDLNPFGIKVTGIHPGLVETEFSMIRFKGDQSKADQVYKGYEPLRPEDVADTIQFVLSRPAHVNVADLVLFPTAQASATVVKKNL